MRDEIVAKLYTAYGVTPARLLPMQKGYRNESHPAELADGSHLNLIIYKTEPGIVARIKNSNYVGDFLHSHGLPARSTADPRILRVTLTKYAALYHYLPGDTIPWDGYTQKHLKALGQAMSDMHAVLQQLADGRQPPDGQELRRGSGSPQSSSDSSQLPSVCAEYLTIFERMQAYFRDSAVQRAMQQKLGLRLETAALIRAQKLFTFCAALKNQQPLHMDFVRSNVLFGEDAQITGIIDFEKTGRGHPVLDVARTLAFLLVDCKYKEPAKIYKYFLQSGYVKRGQARVAISHKLLDELITAFLLHDFYKFLRHNPYEFLEQNEHFTRTRDLIFERGLFVL